MNEVEIKVNNFLKVLNDRLTLLHIIDGILDRVTKLVVLSLAAVIFKTGKGTKPYLPICINIEGTTFSNYNH